MDSLLKNATRVLSLRTLRPLGWLSDSVLLAAETRPIKKPNGKYVYRSVAIELPSRKRQTRGEHHNRFWGGVPSPNGKWVLSDPLNNPTEIDLTGVTLDGKQKRDCGVDKHKIIDSDRWLVAGSKPLWIANGTAWVMLAFQGQKPYALTGSLLGDQSARIVPLGAPSSATGAYGVWTDTIILGHLIESPDGDLIRGVGRSNDEKADTVRFWRWEFRLSQGQRSRKETPFEVPFPKGQWAKDITYSPQTRRIAIVTAPFQANDQWFLHTMALDGSQRVCLGTLPARYGPEKLQWLPSGKKLSFEHDNALWVLPDAPPARPKLL